MLKFIPVQNLAWLVLNRSTVVLGYTRETLVSLVHVQLSNACKHAL